MRSTLTRHAPAVALAPLVAIALAGCGASTVTPDTVAETPAFISGAQHSTGPLEAASTMLSLGGARVSWPDDGQTITVDPNAPSGLSFRRGTMVAARASLPGLLSGTATEVLVRCVVRGPVQSHTPSSLVVAGIDVRLDAQTAVLDGSDRDVALSSIADGVRVEVHGWPESGTRVRASLVRLLPGTPAVLVRGWARAAGNGFDVSLLNGGAAALHVEGSALPLAGPGNAMVRVTGDALSPGTPPTLTATNVAVESEVLPRDGDLARVEGVVTARSSATFALGPHPVQIGGSTWIGIGPGQVSDAVVQPGTHVSVQGPVTRGAIDARVVTVVNHWYADARIAPGSFAVGNPATYGVFTLSGATVVVDTSTAVTGAGGAPLTIAELAGLQAGAPNGLGVRVRGYTRADGDIQALTLEVTGT